MNLMETPLMHTLSRALDLTSARQGAGEPERRQHRHPRL